eukprot:361320-Chlamydomonas_euryale.AAC.1
MKVSSEYAFLLQDALCSRVLLCAPSACLPPPRFEMTWRTLLSGPRFQGPLFLRVFRHLVDVLGAQVALPPVCAHPAALHEARWVHVLRQALRHSVE